MMIVLGIDPGFSVTGFGVIKKELGKSYLLDYGCLTMSSSKPLQERVALFHDLFQEKISQFKVTHIALETPFLGKNSQTFLKLGYLRGCVYLLSHKNNVVLHEFSPMQVKLSATGYGGASKDQVAAMMLRLFPRLELPKKLDVTDALAITLCGIWHCPVRTAS